MRCVGQAEVTCQVIQFQCDTLPLIGVFFKTDISATTPTTPAIQKPHSILLR